MGHSSACLRIIACGRNSGDGNSKNDDLHVSEFKSIKEKLGRSFWKRSAWHRVPSNSVINARATYGNKENPNQSAIVSSQFTGIINDSGKAVLRQCRDEKVQLISFTKSLASEHGSNAENGEEFVAKCDENVQVAAVVIIQAAIRGHLARRKLLKLKDVVKLQPEGQCNLVQKSFTSLENTVELDSTIEPQDREKSKKLENSPGDSSYFSPEATESKLEKETLVPYESDEYLITYEGAKINFHPHRITDSVADGDTERASAVVHSLSNNPKANSFDDHQKFSEQLRHDRLTFTFGSDSGYASDTTLISGGSKFEELAPSVNPISTTLVGSTHQSSGVSNMVNVSSKADFANEEKILMYVGSECGTELSISSTLDSPDRSEAGVTLYKQGKEVKDKGTENYGDLGKLDAEAEEILTDLSTRLTEKYLENIDYANEEFDGSVISIDESQIEQKLQMNICDAEKDLSFQEKLPSQEASSRSQELLRTLSSQVSTKSRDTPDKRSPKKNQKSVSSDKKSPSNPNHEQPPKDPTSGKKRDSFGSYQERRNSTSSNSLPNFMQATESARAKLHANNGSQKLSPDVQERDSYVKKWHSLPGANVKQISSRIQKSRKGKYATQPY